VVRRRRKRRRRRSWRRTRMMGRRCARPAAPRHCTSR
jgi:hypothetical protein